MKKHALKTTGLVLGALICGASVASANITYVDATEANTTTNIGYTYTLEVVASGYPTTAQNEDNEWLTRVVGNGDTAFTANDNNANPGEDAPELRTTLTGLTDGQQYNLYAYFWATGTSGNADWDLAAGLTSGSLTDYKPSSGNATDISSVTVADHFTDGTLIVEQSNRYLYQADLGTAVADATGNMVIYLDDVTGNDDRTWYDGVGYEAVPEPATLGLVAVFGGGVLFIRRRLMI